MEDKERLLPWFGSKDSEKIPLGAEWGRMMPATKMASQEGPVSRQRPPRLRSPGRKRAVCRTTAGDTGCDVAGGGVRRGHGSPQPAPPVAVTWGPGGCWAEAGRPLNPRPSQGPHSVQCFRLVASGPSQLQGQGRERCWALPSLGTEERGRREVVQSREEGVYRLVLFCGD